MIVTPDTTVHAWNLIAVDVESGEPVRNVVKIDTSTGDAWYYTGKVEGDSLQVLRWPHRVRVEVRG